MIDHALAMPGLERVRSRFLLLLETRQAEIADHALTAWDSMDTVKVHRHLEAAQNILHQIAGTAGSLGFGSLGHIARECEYAIIAHLENENGPELPEHVMAQMDYMVSQSQALLSELQTG